MSCQKSLRLKSKWPKSMFCPIFPCVPLFHIFLCTDIFTAYDYTTPELSNTSPVGQTPFRNVKIAFRNVM